LQSISLIALIILGPGTEVFARLAIKYITLYEVVTYISADT
jgi:hypothetical protein